MPKAVFDDSIIEKAIAAFKKHPRMCIHVICEHMDIDRSQVKLLLNELTRRKIIKKASARVAGDIVYELLLKLPMENSDSPEPIKLLGGDEKTARNRIIMLRKMRAKLICEWHPILDIVIRDYETGLRNLDFVIDPEGYEDGDFQQIWSKA